MKNVFLFCAMFLATASVFGQTLDPVSWDSKAEKISDSEYNLTFTATLKDGWYVYSQFLGEDGPIPTSFTFDENANVQFVGKTAETGKSKKEGYDEMFDMNLVKFGGTATFTQKVSVSNGVDKISGYLTYMTCDETRCLPPKEVTFSIQLK